jgi:ABC-type lipoprotein release transport system permease subunit
MMNNLPNPQQFEAEMELKIREQERKRDINLSREDTSNTSQSKRLSRRAFVLIQLTVILLIIVGIVIFLYYLLH